MGIVRLDGCVEYRWPLLFCPGSSFRSRISLGDGTGNGPMSSLRPSVITPIIRCRSSATLVAKPRHAQGISAKLAMWTRPAPCDVTFTGRWRQRSERDEPRTYSADASVDHTSITPKRATTSLAASVDPTDVRKATVRRFGRSVRSAQLQSRFSRPSHDHARSPWS
jgi:hypothetical protein